VSVQLDRPRRILAVLECRRSDEAVLRRSVAAAAESGGYLTLVAVPPRPSRWANSGPYCVPQVSQAELRTHAAAVLARAKAVVPPEIPLMTAVDNGSVRDVIARRVDAAAHDLVVARRRRLNVRLSVRPARRRMLTVLV
jgi:universal stress protein family protein